MIPRGNVQKLLTSFFAQTTAALRQQRPTNRRPFPDVWHGQQRFSGKRLNCPHQWRNMGYQLTV
jgi:hypothetical protein